MVSFPLVTRAFESVSSFCNRPVWNTDATIGYLALHCLPIIGVIHTEPFDKMANRLSTIRLQPNDGRAETFIEIGALCRKTILLHGASIISGIATAVFFFVIFSGTVFHVGGILSSLFHAYRLIQTVPAYIRYLEQCAGYHQPV